MSMISAAIALAAAVTTADDAPTHPHAALLETWRRSSACPKPDSFIPTPVEPFFTATIGEVDGAPVHAYGVRETRIGVSGPFMSATPYYHLEWYFDRDQASAAAALESFRATDEAYYWADQPLAPNHSAATELYQVRTVEGVQIYRVVANEFTWALCTVHDVCRIHHAGIRDLYRPRRPHFPDISDEWEVKVPEIQEWLVGQCPHCRQAIRGFLTPSLGHDAWRLQIGWVATKAEADECRARAVEYIAEQRNQCLARQNAKLERDLKLDAWVPTDDLRRSRRYQDLEALLDPELRTRFDGLCYLGIDEITLAQATELEGVTKEVEQAMFVIEGQILEGIMEHDLNSKLQALLTEQLPRCPLCEAAYDWSSNIVFDLLMAGYLLRPTCACKGRTRSSDEDAPTLLKEFRHLCHYLRSEETLRRHGSFHEIVRLEVGSVMVARALLDFSSERVSIFIDREALKTATGKGAASLTWPRLKAEALERQADLYEEQTGSDRPKLQFRWSEYHRNWSAHTNVDGAQVAFVIHRDHEAGMSEGWWYVRLVNPSHPGEVRRVVGVIPMAMVPPRYIPAQPASTPGPTHARPPTPMRTPFNTPHLSPRRR